MALRWQLPHKALTLIYMQLVEEDHGDCYEQAFEAGAERNNDERHQRKGTGSSVACVQQGVSEKNIQRKASGKGSITSADFKGWLESAALTREGSKPR